jgi:amidase
MLDLRDTDAVGWAERIRARQVSAAEVVDAAIARIEAVDGKVNAVIQRWFDEARAHARGPLGDGPFAGVPFLLKDILAAVKGKPLESGSRLAKGVASKEDSELVRRHRRAGLVFLGKTNAPEMGILPTTEPVLHGATRNPWDLGRTTGGSSGGAAAAVAAGYVPMAHANDGGGSIRIPAAACGLFGLKPTRGRNPVGPMFGEIFLGLVAEHAVTVSVRDSAALLDATAGPDVGDPYWAPPQARPYTADVGAPPGKLRIAWTTASPTGGPVHPDCVAAVADAAALLADLGHEVFEGRPAVDEAHLPPAFITLWTVCNAAAVEQSAMAAKRRPSRELLEPLTFAMHEMGVKTNAVALMAARHQLELAARQFQRFFVDVHLLLTPTLAEPPVALGTFDAPADQPMMGLFRAAAFAPFTAMANVTGQPAMSVPLSWNGAGLPIGTQLIGRFGDEATLFRLAAQLEEARPWARRRPQGV